ncbi:MAG: hypothetical protein AAFX44_04035 [Pseudomonadota bacterium]
MTSNNQQQYDLTSTMLESIIDNVRAIVARLSGGATEQRDPIPPVRASSVQRVMRKPASANGRRRPIDSVAITEDKSDAPVEQPVAETPPHRIISRGNNKNVYVVAVPDLDENDALREADALEIDTGSLETVEEEGCDPYNSGSFHRNQTWHRRR